MTRKNMIISNNGLIKTNIERIDAIKQVHHMGGTGIKNKYQ